MCNSIHTYIHTWLCSCTYAGTTDGPTERTPAFILPHHMQCRATNNSNNTTVHNTSAIWIHIIYLYEYYTRTKAFALEILKLSEIRLRLLFDDRLAEEREERGLKDLMLVPPLPRSFFGNLPDRLLSLTFPLMHSNM